MNLRSTSVRVLVAGSAAFALTLGLAQPALAEQASPAGAQLEALDRGLVAVSTGEGVFLSWRLLGTEAGPATETGVSGPSFAVFRDGERIATVDDSTNYADADGSAASVYTVAPAWNDVTGEQSAPVSVWGDGFYDLPLQKPADGVTPAGEAYTYSANDASVADVDGDGAYEFVVKWDPSNSKDVSQKGYTGTVYVDTYELDGTLLNRIDLGVNIRAGAHYTQFMVYDFDGDGRAETMLKTAPGTKSIRYNADGSVAGPASVPSRRQLRNTPSLVDTATRPRSRASSWAPAGEACSASAGCASPSVSAHAAEPATSARTEVLRRFIFESLSRGCGPRGDGPSSLST